MKFAGCSTHSGFPYFKQLVRLPIDDCSGRNFDELNFGHFNTHLGALWRAGLLSRFLTLESPEDVDARPHRATIFQSTVAHHFRVQ